MKTIARTMYANDYHQFFRPVDWLQGGQLGFRGLIPGGGWEFFLFSTVFRLALGLTQPPVKWVLTGGSFPRGIAAGV
jgi:hypothetical protein